MEPRTPDYQMEKPMKIRQASYQSQKLFLENIAAILSINPAEEVSVLLLAQVYDDLRTWGIPFALLFNEQFIQILTVLYQQSSSEVSEMIRNIFAVYIELFNFEMIPQSSIGSVISSASSIGIEVNSKKRTALTPFESRFANLYALLDDCMAIKSWLENPEIVESIEKENIEAILVRIKAFGTNEISENNERYENYIEEFFDENERKLAEYEAFFVDYIKKMPSGLCAQPREKEINEYPVIKCELKNRTCLYLNEKLKEEEGIDIEFKQYQYPFPQILIENIKNQICAFLNMNGGRIYFGINDMKIVKGMKLNQKSKDLLRNELVNYTADFYPKCRTKYLDVRFIPILQKNSQKYIPNLYVVKLIVKQGDTSKLYSVKTKGFLSYIRMPGQIVPLSAEEITQEILDRNSKPKDPVDQNEFEDIVPDNDLEHSSSIEYNIDPPNIQRTNKEKFPQREYVCVAVKGINGNTTQNELEQLFKETNPLFKRVFVNREDKCMGWAYFNYSDVNTAMKVVSKYHGVLLNGSKLSLRIKTQDKDKDKGKGQAKEHLNWNYLH